jgi:mannitol/fructose-specific phosphotransferase system IIA component (Ntr-type)
MNSHHTVLQYFSPDLFSADLQARNKAELLRELVGIAAAGGGVRGPELLVEMLERRESLGSTGIGKGVAIPHGRSLAIMQLRVVFAVSKKGIEFDAVDGKPVKLFFLIVAPPQDKKNEYLPLLGRIAELVQEKKARDRLLKVESYEQLLTVMEEVLGGE